MPEVSESVFDFATAFFRRLWRDGLLVLDFSRGGWNRFDCGRWPMRISLRGLADLTNVNSMLLPQFAANLPASPSYSGGISGLGQDYSACDADPGSAACTAALNAAASTMPVSGGCTDVNGYAITCPGGTTPGSVVPATYGLSPLDPTNVSASQFGSQATCTGAGYTWNGSACVASGIGGIGGTTLLLIGGGLLAVMVLLMAAKK